MVEARDAVGVLDRRGTGAVGDLDRNTTQVDERCGDAIDRPGSCAGVEPGQGPLADAPARAVLVSATAPP